VTVTKLNSTSLAGLATGLLKNTTGTGVPSIAVANTDYLPVANPTSTGTNTVATLAVKAFAETQPASTAGAGATLTLDLSTGTTFLVTFGAGNITGLTLSNVGSITSFSLRLKQDGTGSRTFSTSGTTVNWASGTAPTLTTTASKADWLTFVWNGASWDGFVGGQNY
jgi:hypothetical protein